MIPAETEEEAYRLRNVRLAEKGFLPFEEAIGVYQPLKPDALKRRSRKHLAQPSAEEIPLPVPLSQLKALSGENLFAEALKRIQSDSILHQLQAEFAGLCNRIIVADQKKIESREALKAVVSKDREAVRKNHQQQEC